MNWSQENCPIDDHRLNLRGMGKGIEESASTKRPDFGLFSSCFYCSFPFAGKSFFVLREHLMSANVSETRI